MFGISSFIIGLVLSLLLGTLIGIQREMKIQHSSRKDMAGLRSFAFVCLFGFLLGYLGLEVFNDYLFLIFGFLGVISFAIVAYYGLMKITKEVSVTTELTFVLTFLIGAFVSFELYHIAISVAVIITLFLVIGPLIHRFAKRLKRGELFATLEFALISAVALPLLPNKTYSFYDIEILKNLFSGINFFDIIGNIYFFNPYTVWLVVVLISGIAFFGYICMKFFGTKRGILLTGFLGGLMSSTALTSAFSLESKRANNLASVFTVGILVACSTMFFRVILEVGLINSELLPYLIIPLAGSGIFGFICAFYLYKKSKINHVKEMELSSPFTLGPAIKFAFFFVFIVLLSKIVVYLFGQKGLYGVAFFSGVADVDAITISLSQMAKASEISNLVASLSIALAAFSNTLVKAGIAYFLGSKELGKKTVFFLSLSVVFGLLLFLI